MIRWTKKEIILFVITVSMIPIIPAIIHILYKLDFEIDFLYSTWSSGEILQYCGAVMTAILAIIGIYYTLKENRKNNLEQTIIETKPYMRTNFINLIKFTELEKLEDNNNLVLIYKNDGIKSIDLKNVRGKRKLQEFNSERHILKNFIIFVYEIENVGLGNALNFSFKLGDYTIFDDVILCKGEKVSVYILIEKNNIFKSGINLDFELIYSDAIEVNTYQQYEKKYVLFDKEKDEILYNENLSSKISKPFIIEKRIFK